MSITTPWSPTSATERKNDNIDVEGIFDSESIGKICQIPGLNIMKRLSCFEEICPSELDEAEAHQDAHINFA